MAETRDSLWTDVPAGSFGRLATGDFTASPTVDVAVVGAGIAGATTAHLLKSAGMTVALLDAGEVGGGATAYSTAKVTAGHGLAYSRIEATHGREAAALYAAAQRDALELVAALVERTAADCALERVDHHVYARHAGTRDAIEREAQAAARAGLAASTVDTLPLPFSTAGAVRFPDQLQFDPRRYVRAVAGTVPGDGSHVFERTRVLDIREGAPCVITAEDLVVRARDVVVATHYPMVDRRGLFGRLEVERGYVVAAPAAEVPEGTYVAADDAARSVRTAPGPDGRILIVSGEHQPTGRHDAQAGHARMEAWFREHFDASPITHRWSVQDTWPLDGLPLAGRLRRGDGRVLIATGFGGWGMTNGTAAARVIAGHLSGEEAAWSGILDPNRRMVRKAAAWLRLNGRVAAEFAGEKVARRRRDAAELAPGEARIVDTRQGKVAAHRDEDGVLHAVSAYCTHLGCVVRWNDGESSWDCPCHGSRFDPDGHVLEPPAVAPLGDRLGSLDAEDRRVAKGGAAVPERRAG